jgi:hypothetical protein
LDCKTLFIAQLAYILIKDIIIDVIRKAEDTQYRFKKLLAVAFIYGIVILAKEGGDIMAVLTEKMLVIKAEKVSEFTAIMKKPMISKAFLAECKKSARSFKELKAK